MLSLHELQCAFASGVFGDDNRRITEEIIATGALDAPARLAIYRNNVLSNYRGALAAVYPVIERLTGEDFFRQAARRYAIEHPSRSGDIHDFGEDFGAFLAAYSRAATLVYLPDVARLEWVVHRVFHAEAVAPIDMQQLAALAPEQFAQIHFRTNPAARLLRSAWPVQRIWQVNQTDFDGDATVNLDEGGCDLLIIRRGFAVAIEPLSAAEYRMLEALTTGSSIEGAYQAITDNNEALELDAFLQRHVLGATLIDPHLTGEIDS